LCVSSNTRAIVLGLLRDGTPGWKKNVVDELISWWSVSTLGRHAWNSAARICASGCTSGSQSRFGSNQ